MAKTATATTESKEIRDLKKAYLKAAGKVKAKSEQVARVKTELDEAKRDRDGYAEKLRSLGAKLPKPTAPEKTKAVTNGGSENGSEEAE